MFRLFKYNDLEFYYKEYHHLIGLAEVYLLDNYRVNLLQDNDFVLDLGAGIGDFSVIASKKVGSSGKVIAIEPNAEDYELLSMNLKWNKCSNVVPLNIGVAKEQGEARTTFWGSKCHFKVDTLENILGKLKIRNKINFIKMDIEGFEAEVLEKSIEIIKEARIISVELHRTKEIVDMILGPYSYLFKPITAGRICGKIIRNLFIHPRTLGTVSLRALFAYPSMVLKTLKATYFVKERLLTGTYYRTQLMRSLNYSCRAANRLLDRIENGTL